MVRRIIIDRSAATMEAYNQAAKALRESIDPNWCVVEPRFRHDRNRHYESNFTLGSGFLSARGVPEEGVDGYETMPGVFVPGVYARHPQVNTEVVNLPAIWGLGLEVDGQRLGLGGCKVKDYHRWLDLRDATLRRTLQWKLKGGGLLGMISERFVSLADPHLAVLRLTLVADRDLEVVLLPNIDARVTTSGWDHYAQVRQEQVDDSTIETHVTTTAGDRVQICAAVTVDGRKPDADRALVEARGITLPVRVALRAGRPAVCNKFVVVHTTFEQARTKQQPGPAARKHIKAAVKADCKTAFDAHARAWGKRWRDMDAVIEGDPECQLGLRFAMFHMTRAHHRDPRTSIDAKCYSSDGYRGRMFWDTEIYMLPLFIYTDPAAARMLARYRYETLPGARKKAAEFHCDGAMFPWESALTGEEEVHLWEHAWTHIHIVGDVCHGIWHYLQATGDDTFFRQCGAEIIIDAARFWASRVDPLPGTNKLQIRYVMGPDEFTQFVHNNYYTNLQARFTLLRAVDCLKRLKKEFPKDHARLVKKLGLDGNAERAFKRVADRLYFPHDAKRDLILQDDEWARRPPLDLKKIKEHNGNWRAFMCDADMNRGQGMKQADVCIAMALHPDDFTDKQKRVAYDVYEPITIHESSLSRSAYAILAADIGRIEEAYRQSREAIAIDLDAEHGRAAGGMHAACQGAVWLVTMRAFAGMQVSDALLRFAPRLPKAWKRLAFTVQYRGRRIGVNLSRSESVFTLQRGAPVRIEVNGRTVELKDELRVTT